MEKKHSMTRVKIWVFTLFIGIITGICMVHPCEGQEEISASEDLNSGSLNVGIGSLADRSMIGLQSTCQEPVATTREWAAVAAEQFSITNVEHTVSFEISPQLKLISFQKEIIGNEIQPQACEFNSPKEMIKALQAENPAIEWIPSLDECEVVASDTVSIAPIINLEGFSSADAVKTTDDAVELIGRGLGDSAEKPLIERIASLDKGKAAASETADGAVAPIRNGSISIAASSIKKESTIKKERSARGESDGLNHAMIPESPAQNALSVFENGHDRAANQAPVVLYQANTVNLGGNDR